MTNFMTDFTNTELLLELNDGEDSVSDLGSTTSVEDDSDSESSSSSSSSDSEDEENPRCYLQRRRSSARAPRVVVEFGRSFHQHHLTLTLPPFARAGSKKHLDSTTQSSSNLSFEAPPKGTSGRMRKTKSLEETDSGCGNRWLSSPSQKGSSEHKTRLSREILDASRWTSSISSNEKLHSSSSTLDHTPRNPRLSATDLKNLRRCSTDERTSASANTRWSAQSSPKPRPSHPPTPTRSSVRRSPIRSSASMKQDSAPEIFRRRRIEGHLEEDSRGEVNARWLASSSRTLSGAFDSLVLPGSSDHSRKKTAAPVRPSLSRWNSSSSFKTTTSISAASIDQWSTRPKLPKRRRTRDSGDTSASKPGSAPPQDNRDEATAPEQLKRREEMGDCSSDTPTTAEDTAEASVISEDDKDPQDTVADVTSHELSTAEDQEDELGEEERTPLDDSFGSSPVYNRYALPPCMECCETIPEEANEDDAPLQVVPRLRSDSVLRVPRRRKSETSLLLGDESDLSMSLSMSLSYSNPDPSLKDSSSSCRRRRMSGNNALCERHDAALGPRQPCRRDSVNSCLLGEQSCRSHSSTENGDGGSSRRERQRTCGHQTAPSSLVNRPWTAAFDEKHPFMGGLASATTNTNRGPLVHRCCNTSNDSNANTNNIITSTLRSSTSSSSTTKSPVDFLEQCNEIYATKLPDSPISAVPKRASKINNRNCPAA